LVSIWLTADRIRQGPLVRFHLPPAESLSQRGPADAVGQSRGCGGRYIRRHLIDDKGTQAAQHSGASPVREAFRTERGTIARLIGLGAAGAVGFYMSFVYITTYLRQIDHVAQSTALDINTISMAVLLLLLAPVGPFRFALAVAHGLVDDLGIDLSF
jgi:hypothetical protein